MRGTHAVRVSNRRLDYRFEVRRNITIVRGDSGTGKTTLYEMIADYTRLGQSSGVQVACDKKCVALVDMDWVAQLEHTRDSIVFLDEGAAYIKTTEFASVVRETDNYYVIITREALYALPYSVDEVYHIKSSGRYHHLERVYHSDERHVYGTAREDGDSNYSTVLTEDSNSGFQFMERRFSGSGVACRAAGGNASIC